MIGGTSSILYDCILVLFPMCKKHVKVNILQARTATRSSFLVHYLDLVFFSIILIVYHLSSEVVLAQDAGSTSSSSTVALYPFPKFLEWHNRVRCRHNAAELQYDLHLETIAKEEAAKICLAKTWMRSKNSWRRKRYFELTGKVASKKPRWIGANYTMIISVRLH